MIKLEKDDIQLRALEPDDLSYLLEWENDPLYWTFSQQRIPYSEYLMRAYLKEAGQDLFEAGQLRLMLCFEGKPIGLVDLFDFDADHQRAALGILIGAKQYRGKGLAKKGLLLFLDYAFPSFNLKQVYVGVASTNKASLGLFEACGFKQYGLRKAWYRQGEDFVDEHCLQLLKEDR